MVSETDLRRERRLDGERERVSVAEGESRARTRWEMKWEIMSKADVRRVERAG